MARKSGFFRKICTSAAWRETEENTVTLQDDDPFAFARLLQFVYHGAYTYDLRRSSSYQPPKRVLTSLWDLATSAHNSAYCEKYGEDSKSVAEYDMEVYVLADKYDVPELKTFSLGECVKFVTDELFDAAQLRSVFAEHYPDRTSHDRDLKNAFAECIAFDFDRIRNSELEWDEGIGKWIKEDFELCTMVMEQLRHQDKKELEDLESDEI